MLRCALILFSLFVLNGCAATMVANDIFDGHHTNLKQVSYAAADMLAQQSRESVKRETPIKIGTLHDVKIDNKRDSSFGKLITSQVGARFVQLGYNIMTKSPTNVQELEFEKQDERMSSNMSEDLNSAEAVITGSYALGKKDVYISLQLVEYRSGKILAAYDYSLPLSSDIKTLAAKDSEKSSRAFVTEFW